MRPNSIVKPIVLFAAMALAWTAGPSTGEPGGVCLVRAARAVVGAPLTPGSVAGVARRTTRRTVIATSAAAQSSASATAQQQQATAQQQAAVAQQQSGAPAVGTVVTALPAGCVQVTEGGVAYQQCGTVRYRPAFQGNTLVYVVQ